MEQKQFSDSKRTKSKLQKLFDEIEEEEKSKIKLNFHSLDFYIPVIIKF